MKRTQAKKESIDQAHELVGVANAFSASERKLKNLMLIIIAAFACSLYLNTINHGYIVDDPVVILQNKFVTKGINGIPEILKTHYLKGYWEKNENSYRPLSLVMFAIEWQIAPAKPYIGHLVNILLYMLTGILLFLTLIKLLPQKNLFLSFLITLLFIAHPIHTEVVANIKSGDELLCFLFLISSLYTLLCYFKTSKIISLILSPFYFFLALLSKESAITWIVILPLIFYFFRTITFKKAMLVTCIFIAIAAVYLGIRASVLGGLGNKEVIGINSNSLAAAPGFLSRFPTAIYIMGKYLWLLFIPHPLLWDYSYNQIKLVTITDWKALISIIVYAALIIYAFKSFRTRELKSFGILFFLISVSLVSNILFLIVSPMGERFLYTPSMGFCIAIAVYFTELFHVKISVTEFSFVRLFKNNKIFAFLMIIVLGLFTFKTISRNADWKDGYVLLQRDIKYSPDNARMHYAYGNAIYYVKVMNEKDAQKKELLLDDVIAELNKSISIYPDNRDVYLSLGIAYEEKGDTLDAIKNFDLAGSLILHVPEVAFYVKLGDHYHNVRNNAEADKYYDKVLDIDPRNVLTLNNYSYDLSVRGEKLDKAEAMSKLANELVPKEATFTDTYGWILYQQGKYAEAVNSLKKAVSYGGDTISAVLEHYGDALFKTGDTATAVDYWQKAKLKDPEREELVTKIRYRQL